MLNACSLDSCPADRRGIAGLAQLREQIVVAAAAYGENPEPGQIPGTARPPFTGL